MAIEVNIREALKGEPNILESEVQEQLFQTRDKVQNLGLSGKSLVDGVLLYLELEESLGPEKALQKLQGLCLRSSAKNSLAYWDTRLCTCTLLLLFSAVLLNWLSFLLNPKPL
jgi:hypothetical protein